jgi:hypothetical protein
MQGVLAEVFTMGVRAGVLANRHDPNDFALRLARKDVNGWRPSSGAKYAK